MNLHDFASIAEIVSGVAVVISLLYLSFQIRRSDQTQRAESVRSVLEGFRERSGVNSFATNDVADLFAKGLTNFDNLTETEKRRFFYLFCESILQMQQCLELHETEFLPKRDYETWAYYTATLIQTPGGKKVWPYIATTVAPSIRDVINQYIADNPDVPSYLELNPLMIYSEKMDSAA